MHRALSLAIVFTVFAEAVIGAVAGYIAYYGTYTVDSVQGIVTHHVEGALFPNWIGRDQVRYFRIDGNQLTITTPPILMGGQTSTTVLVFERGAKPR